MIKGIFKWTAAIVVLSMLLAVVGLPISGALAKPAAAGDDSLNGQLPKFRKLTPIGGVSVDPHKVYLSWTEYPNADRYKFCIYVAAEGGCYTGDPHWTGTFSKYYTVTNLDPNKVYEWRLMASTCWKSGCNEWKEADRGAVSSFTTYGPESTPGPQWVTISGRSTVPGALITFHDDGGTDYFNNALSNGKYSISIPYESTGILFAKKPGEKWASFNPTSYRYEDLKTNLVEQNFRVYNPIQISGKVGVSKATITFTGYGDFTDFNDGGTLEVLSNDSGGYNVTLPWGWMGSIKVEKLGYTFTPSSKSLAPVKTNLTGINFSAKATP